MERDDPKSFRAVLTPHRSLPATGFLIVMAVLVIGYFVLVVRLSDREYREVIEERFDPKRR